MLTNDGFYRQVDGLAMGSPPAPLLANGWLSKFDNLIKGDAKLFARYMDDILREIHISCIDDKLSELNNLHLSLKFTVERENNNSILFLDMKLKLQRNYLRYATHETHGYWTYHEFSAYNRPSHSCVATGVVRAELMTMIQDRGE